MRTFYEESYAADSDLRRVRRETLLQYPVSYTDGNGVEHKWWPYSHQVIGQPIVPLSMRGRERTQGNKPKTLWTAEDFLGADRRQMIEGVDHEGPVIDCYDPSYSEVADAFIVVLGTDKIGVCVVQLEDGVDQELQNNGEGRVEA